MIEGWYNDDYLVLFDEKEEADRMTESYRLRESLPGYTAVGLRGWDDFIVRDEKQKYFTIPTVPLDPKYLCAVELSVDRSAIKPDARFDKKVKWYVKPIMFGGDASAKENMAWVSYEHHAELVRWWSKLYRDTISKNQPG